MMEPPLPTMVVPLWPPVSIATALSPSAETSSVCPFKLIVRLSAPTTMQGFVSLAVAVRSPCRTRLFVIVPGHCARLLQGHPSPKATATSVHSFGAKPIQKAFLVTIERPPPPLYVQGKLDFLTRALLYRKSAGRHGFPSTELQDG